ncbi:ubiquinol-cytochrome C reductase [Halomonas sp. BC04]|nr:ubiquinol-cytochrome C reductase [Halomonas sp. BC04]
MADNGVNKGRRRLLLGATTVVGAVGAVGVAVPFVASWQPSARARAAGAPIQADISKLEPGQRMTVEWRGRPVWIVKRTDDMIERTENFDPARLVDPDSQAPQQPPYVTGPLRSIRPDISVLIGICTHLGCSPLYRPGPDDVDMTAWPGGYFCPCHAPTSISRVACSAMCRHRPTSKYRRTALRPMTSSSSVKTRRLCDG